jgi:hypothetical protein
VLIYYAGRSRSPMSILTCHCQLLRSFLNNQNITHTHTDTDTHTSYLLTRQAQDGGEAVERAKLCRDSERRTPNQTRLRINCPEPTRRNSVRVVRVNVRVRVRVDVVGGSASVRVRVRTLGISVGVRVSARVVRVGTGSGSSGSGRGLELEHGRRD